MHWPENTQGEIPHFARNDSLYQVCAEIRERVDRDAAFTRRRGPGGVILGHKRGSMSTGISIAKRISPMLVAADMEQTLSFYECVLGFAPILKSPDYSIVERDGQTIHFQKAASEEVMQHVRGHTEIYIEVFGIQTLWDHVRTFKDRYRIRDLFEREYGMTEFHVDDPNGCLVFVGEATPKEAKPGI